MSVFHPRNRLVNFRLSDEEFCQLRDSCAGHGSRSISDFARSAVIEKITRGPEVGERQQRVEQLNSKVSELETRVEQLLNLLQASNPLMPPAAFQTAASFAASSSERS